MFVDFDSEINKQTILYLKSKTYNKSNQNDSPQKFTRNNWSLNCHPDVANILWQDFSEMLPMKCQWVLYASPVLIRPDTGIIFGIAEGLNPPLLRLNRTDREEIISKGGKINLSNLDGVYADSNKIGTEWLYCFSFIEDIKVACYKSFLYAGKTFFFSEPS